MATGSYDYFLEQTPIYKNEDSTKYFTMSVVVHALLAISALFVTVPALEKMASEPVLIEFEASDILPEPMKPVYSPKENLGEKVKPTQGAKSMAQPQPVAPLDAIESDVIQGPTQTAKQSKAKLATVKTTTSSGQAQKAATAPSRMGTPNTLDDIAVPQLDEGVSVSKNGQLGDDAFEDEFKNIDRSSGAAKKALKSEWDNQDRLIADENDKALKALENNLSEKSRSLNNALQATRTKNAAALASLQAAERAAAEKAAVDQSQKIAASSFGQGTGASGLGKGATGPTNETSASRAGNPEGLRTLQDLRQVPGNPLPNYSVDERFRREQGKVVFQAYVTKDGRLTQFKLLQSSGFKNLDGKSLAVLKKWRFYEGQEGWVLIPQTWSLKGDVKELPTQLRRSVSRN